MTTLYNGEGKCLDCGYALKQLTVNRCPECGREFDPDDKSSMDMGLSLLEKWLMTPVGWPLHIATVLSGILTLIAYSVPGKHSVYLALAILGWIFVGGVWFERMVLFVILESIHKLHNKEYSRFYLRWAVAPVIFLFVLLTIATEIPQTVTYKLSQSSMNQLAKEVMAAPSGSKFQTRYVGCYKAAKIEQLSNGMRFEIAGAGFLSRVWLCYCPDGQLPELPAIIRSEHFDGDWYLIYIYDG